MGVLTVPVAQAEQMAHDFVKASLSQWSTLGKGASAEVTKFLQQQAEIVVALTAKYVQTGDEQYVKTLKFLPIQASIAIAKQADKIEQAEQQQAIASLNFLTSVTESFLLNIIKVSLPAAVTAVASTL